METKPLAEIGEKIRALSFQEEFDLIVAIANGGIVPAALLNQKLQVDIELLKVHWRDDRQQPEYDKPRLMANPTFDVKGKSVLLVEDRVKTGATLSFARSLLSDARLVRTFAVNGEADYSLYNENCFRFPWNL